MTRILAGSGANFVGAALNFDTYRFGHLGPHVIDFYRESFASSSGGGLREEFRGSFEFNGAGELVGGTLTQFSQFGPPGPALLEIADISLPIAEFALAILNNKSLGELPIFDGPDYVLGSSYGDLLRGYGGDDQFNARGGNDTVFGGAGNDYILGASGHNYLRGEEGNDHIQGGYEFDDVHGNMGDDTLLGGKGDDWVVGGKGQDLLHGEAGNDIVYGNLGDDTCYGWEGDDLMRGGQGNDLLNGLAGNDWLSGDRGDDTISGNLGTDIFHTFGDAGIDRVLDFNPAEGDRVQLDPGTTYSVAQVGADTVISMGGGAQMTLVGVSMATLTDGWIFI